jgi:23S rRNA pseudouridine1911/1915/1917 synthase
MIRQRAAMTRLFEVIYEDGELLVVNKRAGLVCHPTKPDGCSSLISQVRSYLGPAVAPHLVNRLDRETSGVVLVAKTSEAALEMRRTWEKREVRKAYQAIVHGWVENSEGVIDAPLGRDEQSHIAVKDRVRADGAPSQTEYKVVRHFSRAEGRFTLARIWPRTGRKHQIRIHLAHIGHPIVGDKLYGHDEDCYLALVQQRLSEAQKARLIFPNQALHAYEVEFEWRGETARYTAEPEPWFTEFVASASS